MPVLKGESRNQGAALEAANPADPPSLGFWQIRVSHRGRSPLLARAERRSPCRSKAAPCAGALLIRLRGLRGLAWSGSPGTEARRSVQGAARLQGGPPIRLRGRGRACRRRCGRAPPRRATSRAEPRRGAARVARRRVPSTGSRAACPPASLLLPPLRLFSHSLLGQVLDRRPLVGGGAFQEGLATLFQDLRGDVTWPLLLVSVDCLQSGLEVA